MNELLKYYSLHSIHVVIFASVICCCLGNVTERLENNAVNEGRAEEWDERTEDSLTAFKPQHVHISFGDTNQDVTIVWATVKYCDNCQVKYGTNPWQLALISPVNYTHFFDWNWNEEGLHHLYRSQLRSLSPNTTYYYIAICEGVFSGPYFFKVPRVDSDWTPHFLVFGDLGVDSEFFAPLMREATSGEYTAIFHVGDFAYDFGYDKGKKGDKFMELIEQAAAYAPYMTCPGNHEIEEDTFSNYRHRFSMPGSDWPIPFNQMWYSFDIGHVHFISYSSEVFFADYGYYEVDQREWLIMDLEKANRNRHVTPWIIAYGHRPLYCSTNVGDDCSKELSLVRNGLEDIFYNFSVDIVLQAHEHNYERLWPLYKGNVTQFSYVNANAPIQLISGAPGSREGEDRFPNDVKPVWSAFRMDDGAMNSYGRLIVMNNTHIWWEQRMAVNHTTLDSIWIVKDAIATFSAPSPDGHSNDDSIIDDNLKHSLSKYSHVLAVGIVGLSLAAIITAVMLKLVLKHVRKKNSKKPLNYRPPDQSEDIDEEEEGDDSTSLL